MTEQQNRILSALSANGPMTPTEIGMYLGKSYGAASSWACPILKRLVNMGAVERKKEGKKVTYDLGDGVYL